MRAELKSLILFEILMDIKRIFLNKVIPLKGSTQSGLECSEYHDRIWKTNNHRIENRNETDFCMLTLYSATLLNLLISCLILGKVREGLVGTLP